jgi:hypothetical protein
MPDDYDPAQRPSRGAWRDRYGAEDYLTRDAERRERQQQIIQQYRERSRAGCSHGRTRRIGNNGRALWAGLECKAGKCGMIYLSAVEIFQQWRDSQPEAGSYRSGPESTEPQAEPNGAASRQRPGGSRASRKSTYLRT